MSNLTELVPPPELCKLIPEGEFADSCFVRIGEDTIILRSNVRVVSGRQDDIYPAPTLQEIMENMTTLCVTPEIFHAHKNYWTAQGEVFNHDGMYKFHHGCSSNPATAALELWLKLKGIENE